MNWEPIQVVVAYALRDRINKDVAEGSVRLALYLDMTTVSKGAKHVIATINALADKTFSDYTFLGDDGLLLQRAYTANGLVIVVDGVPRPEVTIDELISLEEVW